MYIEAFEHKTLAIEILFNKDFVKISTSSNTVISPPVFFSYSVIFSISHTCSISYMEECSL